MSFNFLKIASTTLTFSLVANNASADNFNYEDLICTDSKGKEVEYIELPEFEIRRAGGLFTFAYMDGDQPQIIYETEFLGQFPIAFQAYVMAHECAHHQNGDLYNIESPSADLNAHFETVVILMEDNADKIALEYLVQEKGYGDTEIQQIVDTWLWLINYSKQTSPRSVPFIENKPNKIDQFYSELTP